MIAVRVILGILCFLDIYWWHVADRKLKPLPYAKLWRTLLSLFVVVMLATLVTRMFQPAESRTIGSRIPMSIVAAQYIWHLLILPIICIVPLLYRAARTLWRGASWFTSKLWNVNAPTSTTPPADTTLPTRRNLLKAAAVAGPPLVLAGGVGGAIAQLGKFRVRKFDLPIARLPRELDGMTIAHLSDFHFGRFMTPTMARPVIDAVNDMRADLVLVTGDLIDYALVDLPAALDVIKRIAPPGGSADRVAMCMGNHDKFEDPRAFARQVKRAGVNLLLNSDQIVDVRGREVQLLGIDWAINTYEKPYDEQTADLVKYTNAFRKSTAFPILLAHHPHAFDQAADLNLPLTLAGHTHGGQLMLTKNFGAATLARYRYWSGLYTKPNGSKLIVSNGIGNWFPLRVNAPAEIVHLTLHRSA